MRREQILATYAASDYAAVEWIVPELQLARLLRQEINDMGLADFMRVTHGERIGLPSSPTKPGQLTTEVSR